MKNGDTVYLIKYTQDGESVYYLNRTSFPTIELANREIELLIKEQRRLYVDNPVRTEFEAIPHVLKNVVNKSIK